MAPIAAGMWAAHSAKGFPFRSPPVDFGSETLGHRIARIRKERGLTQVELAAKIGVIQPIVASVEGDERKLVAKIAVRFARVLDVSNG